MSLGGKDSKAEVPRRFLVNSMLGQTAKWLRLLGYDAEYVAHMKDEDIIKRAKEERRILLTSDWDLKKKASKMGCEAFLIEGRTEPERLFSIATRYEITLEFSSERARCSLCNGELHEIPKASIEGLVPEKVFQRQDRFWRCDGCGKIYWRGTHVEGIRNVLEEMRHVYVKKEIGNQKET
ncbi:Mut7-C RNAse domain-containing protein [Candidatus Bathyarchaeota archaeon]|nr:Mut7-C RNAse domain-containing protein [Candidatus Bathyarchaeota archaeon]MBS7627211.1 Mut7-C RNAse domain-containing protein [Candidatus Bathyarchaeota archaeon]